MSGVLKTSFSQELARLDMAAIAQGVNRVSSPIDAHVFVRALFVLGRYAEADSALISLNGLLKADPFFLAFAKLQPKIYRRTDLISAAKELAQIKPLVTSSLLVQGDYHFVFGYCLALQSELAEAMVHHRAAAECYRRGGFAGLECQAVFNQCVSSNHLGDRESFDTGLRRLEALVKANPGHTAIALFHKRIQAYRQVDAEDFVGAQYLVKEVLNLCEAEGRWRDMGGMFCLYAYLLLRAYEFDEFKLLYARVVAAREHLLPEHQRVLKEFRRLEAVTKITAAQAAEFVGEWTLLAIDSVHLLFLYSVLLDKLLLAKEYDALLRLAQTATGLAKKSNQALTLVDFRRFEVEGYAGLGNVERAMSVLRVFREEAIRQRSAYKTAVSKRLETQIVRAYESSLGMSLPKNEPVLLIDPLARTIVYRGVLIPLHASPIVLKFLKVLALKGKALPLPEAFLETYGYVFEPHLHQSRFNSLIDRARNILSDSSIVVREGGSVFLNPRVEVRVEPSSAPSQTMLSRRDRILRAISTAGGPISISQLEKQFQCTRRTIQLDLKQLIQDRAIRCTGGTKNRRYLGQESV